MLDNIASNAAANAALDMKMYGLREQTAYERSDGCLIGRILSQEKGQYRLICEKDEKLLPFVKSGGYIYIAIPCMKKDCHEHLPAELLLSWTPEQLDYMHDAAYWRDLVSRCRGAEVLSVSEMENNEEVWDDWLRQENEYAVGDRKAMEAGGGKYLNFKAIVLRKK